MDLWQTGREGAWNLAGRVDSLGGGSGGARRGRVLNGRTRRKSENRDKRGKDMSRRKIFLQLN